MGPDAPLYERLTPLQYAALMDDARRRAEALRREAIRNFWTSLFQALSRAVRPARRALRRASPPAPAL